MMEACYGIAFPVNPYRGRPACKGRPRQTEKGVLKGRNSLFTVYRLGTGNLTGVEVQLLRIEYARTWALKQETSENWKDEIRVQLEQASWPCTIGPKEKFSDVYGHHDNPAEAAEQWLNSFACQQLRLFQQLWVIRMVADIREREPDYAAALEKVRRIPVYASKKPTLVHLSSCGNIDMAQMHAIADTWKEFQHGGSCRSIGDAKMRVKALGVDHHLKFFCNQQFVRKQGQRVIQLSLQSARCVLERLGGDTNQGFPLEDQHILLNLFRQLQKQKSLADNIPEPITEDNRDIKAFFNAKHQVTQLVTTAIWDRKYLESVETAQKFVNAIMSGEEFIPEPLSPLTPLPTASMVAEPPVPQPQQPVHIHPHQVPHGPQPQPQPAPQPTPLPVAAQAPLHHPVHQQMVTAPTMPGQHVVGMGQC